MPKRSKLLQALDDHRGRDYDAEKQKKQVKAAAKKKAAKGEKVEVCSIFLGALLLRTTETFMANLETDFFES